MNLFSILKYKFLFCFVFATIVFSQQIVVAQTSTEDAALQKENAGQFDQRGYGNNDAINVDGKLDISTANGNVSYSYPISSRTIQGFPMNTTLNYCGSVGFTAFGAYKKRALQVGYEVTQDRWEQYNQTRSAWIVGFNGFAIQVLGFNNMYCINPYLYYPDWQHPEETDSVMFDENSMNWVIEGYDYCNRMQDLWLDRDQDVIKLLRADGSVMELRNGNTKQNHYMAGDANERPDLFTGDYYVNEPNSKGFGIVEYSNKYLQKADAGYPNYMNYFCQWRPRVLRYFPGDGLEYVFYEWFAPFGRQHPSYSGYMPIWSNGESVSGAEISAFLLGTRFGGFDATPTIFYLKEVKDGAISLTSFNHSRHSSSPLTIATDKVDSTKGRATLTEFDGHKFSYNNHSMTIQALGRTMTVNYDSVTKDGYRKPTDYSGIPWWSYSNFSLAQKTAETSVFDREQYRSYLGMVTSIVDPVHRVTKFGYENYYRKYVDTRFLEYDSGNVINLKNYRMTSVSEPTAQYTIHYNSDVATERSYTQGEELSPFVQKNITNIVDEVKKFSKDVSLTDTNDYLTKTIYIFEEDDIFNLNGKSHISTYDKVTGLTYSKNYTYKYHEYSPIVFDDEAEWRTPIKKYTYLDELSETGGGITTITRTFEDSAFGGNGSRFLYLPKTKEVLVVNHGTSDTIRKSYQRFGYSFTTVRTYDSNSAMGFVPSNMGKEVATDTVFVYAPDNINGAPLFYKTNTYFHLPISHDTIDIIDSIWLKDESIRKYQALRAESDADVIGKSWEETLCDSRVKAYRFDTLNNISVTIPPLFGLPMKEAIYENSTFIKGKSTLFNIDYSTSSKPLFRRGLAISDTLIGKNGTRKFLSSLYDYSKVNRRGGGLLSMKVNANGAKHEQFYEYTQPIDYSVAPGESCSGFVLPRAYKLDNIDEVDTTLLKDWVYTSYLYEAPFAEQSKIRKYKIGIGDTARLDSTSISHVYERGYFGQVISSVSPNGWLSKYTYDNNGRILQVNLPGDYSTSSPEDLTESYQGVIDIGGAAYTGMSFYRDSVHCTNSPKTRSYKTFEFVDEPDNEYMRLYVAREAPHHTPCPCGDPEDSSGIHIPTARKGGGGKDGAATLETIDGCNKWLIQDFDVTHYATMYSDISQFNASGNEIDSVIFRVHVTAVNGDFINLKLSFPQLDTTIYYLLNSSDVTDSSVERKFLTVNLSSKLGQLTTLAAADSEFVVKASTSTLGGAVEFANDASDTYPVLKLYGKFRTKLADFTQKFSYSENSSSPSFSVLTKTDDGQHTSNSWAEDTYVRRWKAINQFGTDYQVKKATTNIGTLTDYRTDSVINCYTGIGKKMSETDPEGFVVYTNYDAWGRPDTVINADSTIVTMVYDFGTPSDYSILDSTYYGFCSRKVTKDEKGLEIRQYFDAFDQLKKEIVDSGGIGHLNITTKYEYDSQGRVKKVINPLNQTIRYWYDDFGRVKYKHHPDMGVYSYKYDNMGNTRFTQTQEQSQNNKFTYYQYDDLNRITVVGEAAITKTVYPDTSFVPSDTMNLKRWTDSLDATVLHDNNNSAILTANKTLWKTLAFGVPAVPVVTQPPSHPEFSACIANEPYYPETVPPEFPVLKQGVYGSTATNPYPTTPSNFEDISTHPEYVRMVTQYDELPAKTGAVWGNFKPTDGAGIWDSLAPKGKIRNLKGNQAAVAYRNKASEPFHYQVYSYDERGRVEAIIRYTENLGYDAVYYKYNSMNRIVQQTVVDAWRQSITWYGYDYNGRVDTVWSKITADGTGLFRGSNTSSLDSLKRPVPVTKTSDCARLVYRYTKRGKLDTMLTLLPELVTTYRYNARGSLDSLHCTAGGQNIFMEHLEYDVDGQVVTQHWKHETFPEDSLNYEYDKRKQLTKWSNPQIGRTDYEYDNTGNRRATKRYDGSNTPTYNDSYSYAFGMNRLDTFSLGGAGKNTYSYYKDGALKKNIYSTYTGKFWENKVENYGYGYNGLLTSYSLENTFSDNINCFTDDGTFKWEWTYRYGATGERESKRLTTSPLGDAYASHNWNYYLLGSNNEQLAVYNGRETNRNDCFTSGHRVYFYPSEYITYGNGNLAVLTTRADGNQEYMICDHLGSTRAIVDSTGYVKSNFDYEPFGSVLSQTGADSRKAFIGKERDYESDLSDNGARKYNPVTGRFTSPDMLWEQYQQWNPYQYAANNPVRMVDANGKEIWIDYQEMVLDENGQWVVQNLSVQYIDGELYNKDGTKYTGNNQFVAQVKKLLDWFNKSSNPEISNRFHTLENSKRKHTISETSTMYNGDANVTQPEVKGDRDNGIPTGSSIILSFEAMDSKNESYLVTIGHELLGHAYTYETGTYAGELNYTKTGVKLPEVQGVNMENVIRSVLGLPQRTEYEGQKIPSYMLWKTHKK